MQKNLTIDGLDRDLEKKLQVELVNDILALAKQQGATQAEASLVKVSGVSIQSRNKEIETLEFNRDSGLSLTVYVGKRKGSVSTSDLSKATLNECVQSAIDIARFTAEDEFSGLADADLMATDLPDLKLDYPSSLSVEDCISRAVACEKVGLEYDERIINSDGGSFSSHRSIRTYANSNGFIATNVGTRHGLSCSLIGESQGEMHRDGWYSVARELDELESIEEVGKKAAEQTLSHLGPRRLKKMKVPVIFHSDISSGIMSHLCSAISGGNLYRKSSFLLDQLGQQVLPSKFTIYEDPRLIKGFASSAFDAEGVATYKHDIVKDGILQSYVLGSYSARRLGLKTTANAGGLRNVFVSHDDLSFDELLKKMDRGVLITDVMGQGVNIVTGDYSRGAEGFWVENGEIQYPVTEFTVAGNLRSMLMDIDAIASDVDLRKSTQCGSILLNEMMIAGSQ